MNEWMDKWMNKWKNEWMREWITDLDFMNYRCCQWDNNGITYRNSLSLASNVNKCIITSVLLAKVPARPST